MQEIEYNRTRMMVVTMFIASLAAWVHWFAGGMNWPLAAVLIIVDLGFVSDTTLQMSLSDGIMGDLKQRFRDMVGKDKTNA